MIVKGFQIILVAFLLWSPVSCQSSFFYKRIPVIHLDDDTVDVYEVTGMDGHRQHHGRHSSNHPEVSGLISMLLSSTDTDESFDHHPVRRRQQSFSRRRSFARVTQRWPEGVIPFVIHGSLRRNQKLIFSAMREIESQSCIRFKERDDEEDFVMIRSGSGCYSSVGRKGGMQTVSLGRGCSNFGIILHELMHVIGFYHLHQRHDRDKYLDIHWQNINPMYMNNFKLLGPEHIPMDERFDYHSIMMYGDTSFSRDSQSITMTPTSSGIRLLDPAFKTGLSDIDVRSIRKMYDCQTNHLTNFLDYE